MIGKRLKHYEVEAVLGKGGMGEVYRARDLRLERPVALKVLKSELTGDADRQRRFLREARAASAVTHPAIAQIYDVDEADGVTFIAMEFVEGKTVRKLSQNRELDLQGSIEIALQIAEGLSRAHEAGIIHRDIKSDNIMVTPDGHAKILDFGLAKLLDAPGVDGEQNTSAMETVAKTRAGMVMGTIAYMSPEQARGHAVDQRSDIFSLGIVLYEMVAGEMPFQGASALDTMHAIAYDEIRPVTVVRRNIPTDVQRVVARCLRKRPEDRYATAAVLASDLKDLRRDIESGISRTSSAGYWLESVKDWLRSTTPKGWGLTSITLAALATLTVLIVMRVEAGGLIAMGFVGLVIFRFIKTRRRRLTRRIVRRIAKLEDVKAIRLSENLITVFTEQAKAKLYIRVNSLLDTINDRHFFGDELKAEIRDDLTPEEFQRALREPGIAHVRKDVLDS